MSGLCGLAGHGAHLTTGVVRWGRRPNPIWISQMVDLEAGGELVTHNWALWLKV